MKLIVNDKQYTHFTSFTVELIYNAVASSFSFTGLNKMLPNRLEYPECEIYGDDGELLITGNLISEKQISSAEPNTFTVSGYSKAGIIEDANLPLDLYPLQYDRLSLRDMSRKILPYFGLDYSVRAQVINDFYSTYKKVSMQPEETILSFLDALASQKQIIISHDERGNVVYTRPYVPEMRPVLFFKDNDAGVINAEIRINGQNMFSDITVLRQASSNVDGGQFTVKNPYVRSKYKRTKTKILNAGDIYTVESAAYNELRKELRNIKITIQTQSMVRPGQLISFQNSELGINKPVDLFVESVTIRGTSDARDYRLSCVLADVYGLDKNIKNIFDL